MKTKLILLSAFFLALTLILAFASYAAIPHLMNFQGKATDKAGAPLNGTYNLTFRIYNSETGGTPKWTETQPNISITNGIFQVQLGSVGQLNLPFDESYWISIEINTDGEMSPRTRLASVGYAYTAETANDVNMPVGSVVQVVNTMVGTYAIGRTALPFDDTIPTQSSPAEGTEFMTLAITPTSAANKLKIDVVFFGSQATGSTMSVALFQDNTANALAAVAAIPEGESAEQPETITFTHYMTAGTTSSTTFKVRAGNGSGVAVYFNGQATNQRRFGGVAASSITITEIKA